MFFISKSLVKHYPMKLHFFLSAYWLISNFKISRQGHFSVKFLLILGKINQYRLLRVKYCAAAFCPSLKLRNNIYLWTLCIRLYFWSRYPCGVVINKNNGFLILVDNALITSALKNKNNIGDSGDPCSSPASPKATWRLLSLFTVILAFCSLQKSDPVYQDFRNPTLTKPWTQHIFSHTVKCTLNIKCYQTHNSLVMPSLVYLFLQHHQSINRIFAL